MNAFMVQVAAKDTQLRHLIPDYIDILALFISNINEKQIAQVVIGQFKAFIGLVGRQLSPNQWNCYVSSLQNLFEATIPQSLIDEKERYLESELMKKQGHQEQSPRQASPNAGLREGELPFNQDACFTKCIVQLLLISAAAETVDKFYDQLSLHVRSLPLNSFVEPIHPPGVSREVFPLC